MQQIVETALDGFHSLPPDQLADLVARVRAGSEAAHRASGASGKTAAARWRAEEKAGR